jgi:RNA 2',3'-cyclic 3'-phosphodiesterase
VSGVRLFVAVPLEERLRVELAAWCERQRLDGARWTPVVNLHVTVHFLGGAEEASVAPLGDALDVVVGRFERFALQVADARLAPKRRPRMVWAAIERDERFDRMAVAVAEACGPFALRAKPPRPGRPHITLARLRDPATGELDPLDLSDPAVPVDQLALVQSHLSPKGTTYETLRAFSLGA